MDWDSLLICLDQINVALRIISTLLTEDSYTIGVLLSDKSGGFESCTVLRLCAKQKLKDFVLEALRVR